MATFYKIICTIFLRSAAERNHAPALYNLGLCYEKGLGVTANEKTVSKKHFKVEKTVFFIISAKRHPLLPDPVSSSLNNCIYLNDLVTLKLRYIYLQKNLTE